MSKYSKLQIASNKAEDQALLRLRETDISMELVYVLKGISRLEAGSGGQIVDAS
jgi:hypothetical protein